MDLIFANSSLEDVGVLMDYELDMAVGVDENNFECKIGTNSHYCQAGWYLYVEGKEYGGIIDSIESKSGAKEVTYSGRSWHGILNSKVLCPDAGADYLTLNGEANSVIGSLLTRLGLTALFSSSPDASGLTISNYKMDRFISGYDGIKKMLKSVGGKLLFSFVSGHVLLSAVPIVDYTQDEQFDSGLVDLDVMQKVNTVNHLICLGQGDLSERTVIHLYAAEDGTISTTQTQFGMNEVVDILDYPNAESSDELQKTGIERLKELWEPAAVSIDFDSTADSYDIGDIIGAYDNVTGIAVSARISKKIMTIRNGQTNISYEVGE